MTEPLPNLQKTLEENASSFEPAEQDNKKSDAKTQSRYEGWWWFLLSALLLLPIFYVLSYPPVVLCVMQIHGGYEDVPNSVWSSLEILYAPITWLSENSEMFEKIFLMYCDLW